MTDSLRKAERKTEAERTLTEQFEARRDALSQCKGGFLPSLAERSAAAAHLAEYGLPTRKTESWHFTDLRRILSAIAPWTADAECEIQPSFPRDAPVFAVINGKAQRAENLNADGLQAAALAENSHAETAFTVLPAEEKKDKGDVLGAINTAFAADGWHIDIAGGEEISHAVELQIIQNGGQAHNRFPVHVGAGARLTVLERQIGDNSESFLTSDSEVKIADNAQVHWFILRERGVKSAEFNRFQALLGKNSKLTLYIINAGAHFLRQEVNVDLAGEGASFQLRGINLLSGKSHTDTTMAVRHLAEGTDSTEIFRNVVTEEAHGVFQGIIRVAQAAQKTDARMACNSLILSDKAEFDAKPELEIFADDVACGHGATVAEINREHLFYLMARGIPEGEARALLVKAFVAELIDELPDEMARSLHQSVDNWLERHFRTA